MNTQTVFLSDLKVGNIVFSGAQVNSSCEREFKVTEIRKTKNGRFQVIGLSTWKDTVTGEVTVNTKNGKLFHGAVLDFKVTILS